MRSWGGQTSAAAAFTAPPLLLTRRLPVSHPPAPSPPTAPRSGAEPLTLTRRLLAAPSAASSPLDYTQLFVSYYRRQRSFLTQRATHQRPAHFAIVRLARSTAPPPQQPPHPSHHDGAGPARRRLLSPSSSSTAAAAASPPPYRSPGGVRYRAGRSGSTQWMSESSPSTRTVLQQRSTARRRDEFASSPSADGPAAHGAASSRRLRVDGLAERQRCFDLLLRSGSLHSPDDSAEPEAARQGRSSSSRFRCSPSPPVTTDVAVAAAVVEVRHHPGSCRSSSSMPSPINKDPSSPPSCEPSRVGAVGDDAAPEQQSPSLRAAIADITDAAPAMVAPLQPFLATNHEAVAVPSQQQGDGNGAAAVAPMLILEDMLRLSYSPSPIVSETDGEVGDDAGIDGGGGGERDRGRRRYRRSTAYERAVSSRAAGSTSPPSHSRTAARCHGSSTTATVARAAEAEMWQSCTYTGESLQLRVSGGGTPAGRGSSSFLAAQPGGESERESSGHTPSLTSGARPPSQPAVAASGHLHGSSSGRVQAAQQVARASLSVSPPGSPARGSTASLNYFYTAAATSGAAVYASATGGRMSWAPNRHTSPGSSALYTRPRLSSSSSRSTSDYRRDHRWHHRRLSDGSVEPATSVGPHIAPPQYHSAVFGDSRRSSADGQYHYYSLPRRSLLHSPSQQRSRPTWAGTHAPPRYRLQMDERSSAMDSGWWSPDVEEDGGRQTDLRRLTWGDVTTATAMAAVDGKECRSLSPTIVPLQPPPPLPPSPTATTVDAHDENAAVAADVDWVAVMTVATTRTTDSVDVVSPRRRTLAEELRMLGQRAPQRPYSSHHHRHPVSVGPPSPRQWMATAADGDGAELLRSSTVASLSATAMRRSPWSASGVESVVLPAALRRPSWAEAEPPLRRAAPPLPIAEDRVDIPDETAVAAAQRRRSLDAEGWPLPIQHRAASISSASSDTTQHPVGRRAILLPQSPSNADDGWSATTTLLTPCSPPSIPGSHDDGNGDGAAREELASTAASHYRLRPSALNPHLCLSASVAEAKDRDPEVSATTNGGGPHAAVL